MTKKMSRAQFFAIKKSIELANDMGLSRKSSKRNKNEFQCWPGDVKIFGRKFSTAVQELYNNEMCNSGCYGRIDVHFDASEKDEYSHGDVDNDGIATGYLSRLRIHRYSTYLNAGVLLKAVASAFLQNGIKVYEHDGVYATKEQCGSGLFFLTYPVPDGYNGRPDGHYWVTVEAHYWNMADAHFTPEYYSIEMADDEKTFILSDGYSDTRVFNLMKD